MFTKIWNDENGFVISAEIILVATILIIGLVAGLTSLRDGVIEEMADVGQSIGNADQSFSVSGTQAHSSATASFGFADARDFCDGGTTTSNVNSRCLVISPATAITGGEGLAQ